MQIFRKAIFLKRTGRKFSASTSTIREFDLDSPILIEEEQLLVKSRFAHEAAGIVGKAIAFFGNSQEIEVHFAIFIFIVEKLDGIFAFR